MVGELPKTVTVNGKEYRIRTDFRDILRIMVAFNDPELEDKDKAYVCLYIMYPDLDTIPKDDIEAAFNAATAFIEHGAGENSKAKTAKLMDWEQDESIMFPAINKVAGFETRAAEYIHWWTFLGYYMEISDGVFANVLNLRMKKSKGKKLEKWEQEYWSSNKGICVLRTKYTEAEKEQMQRINEMLNHL